MAEARTTREALVADLIGDLDSLLERIERLPGTISEAETRLILTAKILEDAGDKYRLAVTTFTEEAKSSLTEYVQHKALQAITLAIAEQQTLLQNSANTACQDARPRAAPASGLANDTGSNALSAYRARTIECTIIALLASLFTVAVLRFIFHMQCA